MAATTTTITFDDLPAGTTVSTQYDARGIDFATGIVGLNVYCYPKIAPIPGTKRVSRVEENIAADGIELTAEQIGRLDELTPATGERHEEANMAAIDR